MISPYASAQGGFTVSRSPHLPEVEVARDRYGEGSLPPFRFLPTVQVTFVVEGCMRLRIGSQAIVLEPGDVLLNGPECNPRVLERVTPTGGSLRALISPRAFNALAGSGAANFAAGVFRRPALAKALERLDGAMTSGEPAGGQREALGSLVRAMLEALGTSEGTRLRSRPLRPEVRRLWNLIHERFAEQLPLAEISEAMGLSRFHLLRQFRDQIGATPHLYQMQLRVSQAREMLHGKRSVSDVALACGFSDQSHFTRCFKRIVGYTPAAFKRLS